MAKLTFHLFLCKIQLTVYMRITKPVLGKVNLGGRVVLTGSLRVTLEGMITFCHINTLDYLTRTALGLVSVI